MSKAFTGRHMAATMVAFFGTIIAVNMTMASYATGTFSGTVVDNSYAATRDFNSWLAEARAQERLGWEHVVTLDAERRLVVSLTAGGETLRGAEAAATARHPVGRTADVELPLAEVAPGTYRSAEPLPAGRWNVHLILRHGGSDKRAIERVS